MQYAIAYCDMNGCGFSVLEPFVHEGLDSYDDAKRQQDAMIQNGFRHVTIFAFEENELPEYITWNFVNSHLCGN